MRSSEQIKDSILGLRMTLSNRHMTAGADLRHTGLPTLDFSFKGEIVGVGLSAWSQQCSVCSFIFPSCSDLMW